MSDQKPTQLDIALIHRRFSVSCFNQTWELIEKPGRSREEDEAMILCSITSLWHWLQRPDCTDRNRSIGHWQVSRVFALVGDGASAMKHALRCMEFSKDLSPFHLGFAHEAIARAAKVLKDDAMCQTHLAEARECLARVTDDKERQNLENDLKSI